MASPIEDGVNSALEGAGDRRGGEGLVDDPTQDDLKRPRLGLIWPATGEALADFEMASAEWMNALPFGRVIGFDVAYSRAEPGHTIDVLRRVGEAERLLEPGRELKARNAEAIVWACTSGSFIGGYRWALDQLSRLEDALGVPVTSATVALIQCARRSGLHHVDVLSPYPEEVSEVFYECLSDAGLSVETRRSLHSPGATASANLPLVDLCRDFAESCGLKGDAVLIPDTAVNSLDLMPELEEALRRPVLSVNQACILDGAYLLGQDQALSEFETFRGLWAGRPRRGG